MRIKSDDYAASLRGTSREKFSEGASGAFLYFSADSQFIVKTMTPSEFVVLMRILPAYVRYVEQNPKSLLTRFIGCHSIRLQSTGKIFFVVMTNIFYKAKHLHERYDLKGSWINRSSRADNATGEGKRVATCKFCQQYYLRGAPKSESTCPVRPNGKHSPSTVLKDMDVNWRFTLEPDDHARLVEQMEQDAAWLRDQEIMDYSLLVGVHRKIVPVNADVVGKGSLNAAESAAAPLHSYAAPFATAPGIFYFGIIDILQDWSLGKRVERAFKTCLGAVFGAARERSAGISAVAPDAYHDRFRRRVIHSVFSCEDHRSTLADEMQHL